MTASCPQRFEGTLYGPIRSRRLGRSLGIDLSPAGSTVCNFACVYCELAEDRRTGGWPKPGQVESVLANALPRAGPLDSITISGRGEPTLHPAFAAVVASVVAVARRARPGLPVRILSNGSRAVDPVARRALDLLDERIVKLDAAAERVERPSSRTPLGAILHACGLLRDFTLQSFFIEGSVCNTDEASLSQWLELVADLRPRAVQVSTIDRPARTPGVRAVSPARLEEIARRVEAEAGVRVVRGFRPPCVGGFAAALGRHESAEDAIVADALLPDEPA